MNKLARNSFYCLDCLAETKEDCICNKTIGRRQGHTLKVNSPPQTDTENVVPTNSQQEYKEEKTIDSSEEPSAGNIVTEQSSYDIKRHSIGDANESNIQPIPQYLIANKTEDPLYSRSANENINKNSASARGVNYFQRVTGSHGHTLLESDDGDIKQEEEFAYQQVIAIIEAVDGHEVTVNTAIESAHSKSERVRNYIGPKLTQRENKRVKNLCVKIIRNENVQVVKYKPQLVVKWAPVGKSDSASDCEVVNQ